ncbi:hypothetical protein PR048_004544 [Dryococelus australis]|uniref:MADF domain-containing protein n=1 Tax=Dryococelus australis TaxID=614101 RepID=A0ABQ9I5N4_9NEOP|nr:hypothetical protein PR048_004544 [Dryococelus australis]
MLAQAWRLAPGGAPPQLACPPLKNWFTGVESPTSFLPRRSAGGETGDPRENPPTNGIVRHDSHMRESGVTWPGIKPGSPWLEAIDSHAQALDVRSFDSCAILHSPLSLPHPAIALPGTSGHQAATLACGTRDRPTSGVSHMSGQETRRLSETALSGRLWRSPTSSYFALSGSEARERQGRYRQAHQVRHRRYAQSYNLADCVLVLRVKAVHDKRHFLARFSSTCEALRHISARQPLLADRREEALCGVGQCTRGASASQTMTDSARLDMQLSIEEVKKYHEIWDITHCDHHDRIKKRAAWYAICEKFANGFAGKPDGEEGEIGQGVSSTRRYIYARQLSFLLKTVQPGVTDTSVDDYEAEESAQTAAETSTASDDLTSTAKMRPAQVSAMNPLANGIGHLKTT